LRKVSAVLACAAGDDGGFIFHNFQI
jgi:hypothetical protein